MLCVLSCEFMCVCVWLLPCLICFVKICNFFRQHLSITLYHTRQFPSLAVYNSIYYELVVCLTPEVMGVVLELKSCSIFKKKIKNYYFLLFNSKRKQCNQHRNTRDLSSEIAVFHNAADTRGYQGASHTTGQDADGEQNQRILPGLRQQQVDEPSLSDSPWHTRTQL